MFKCFYFFLLIQVIVRNNPVSQLSTLVFSRGKWLLLWWQNICWNSWWCCAGRYWWQIHHKHLGQDGSVKRSANHHCQHRQGAPWSCALCSVDIWNQTSICAQTGSHSCQPWSVLQCRIPVQAIHLWLPMASHCRDCQWVCSQAVCWWRTSAASGCDTWLDPSQVHLEKQVVHWCTLSSQGRRLQWKVYRISIWTGDQAKQYSTWTGMVEIVILNKLCIFNGLVKQNKWEMICNTKVRQLFLFLSNIVWPSHLPLQFSFLNKLVLNSGGSCSVNCF